MTVTIILASFERVGSLYFKPDISPDRQLHPKLVQQEVSPQKSTSLVSLTNIIHFTGSVIANSEH